jgi:hypothetical protein
MMMMTSIQDNPTDVQQNALAVAQALLEEKEAQIQALKLRIGVLEDLLSKLSAHRVPQAQQQRALKPAPKRWSVR